MKSLSPDIEKIFSGKNTSVIIILLVVAVRILQLIFFYNIRVDGMYQVMAMQNFVHGHGISTSSVLPADLSTTIYQPLINWPPGYSVLLAPFYLLFGHNYIAAGLTVDILAAIALILLSRRILFMLDVPLYLINIFTLLTGFFIYYFYFIASSDAVAITFFCWGVDGALRLLKKGHSTIALSFSLIISLFLAGFIKYLFIPVVFTIPVFIFFKGYSEKNGHTKKTAILTFFYLLFSFGALLLYQKFTAGTAVYISEPSRGFYPENLLSAWPAYPASFIQPGTIGLLSAKAEAALLPVFQVTHIILFIFSCIIFTRSVIKGGLKNVSIINNYFYLGFLLSASITLVLAALSLQVGKEENIPGHWWTYIEEPRYYGLVNVMLHIGVFAGYQFFRQKRQTLFKNIALMMILLLLFEAVRGIVFTTNRVRNINKEEYSWQYERSIQRYADSLIKKEQWQYPGSGIAVTGSFYYYYNRVGIYSHAPALSEPLSINTPRLLNTQKPVSLLVILHENDQQYFQPFLENKEKELAGYYRGFYFYTLHVNPH